MNLAVGEAFHWHLRKSSSSWLFPQTPGLSRAVTSQACHSVCMPSAIVNIFFWKPASLCVFPVLQRKKKNDAKWHGDRPLTEPRKAFNEGREEKVLNSPQTHARKISSEHVLSWRSCDSTALLCSVHRKCEPPSASCAQHTRMAPAQLADAARLCRNGSVWGPPAAAHPGRPAPWWSSRGQGKSKQSRVCGFGR